MCALVSRAISQAKVRHRYCRQPRLLHYYRRKRAGRSHGPYDTNVGLTKASPIRATVPVVAGFPPRPALGVSTPTLSPALGHDRLSRDTFHANQRRRLKQPFMSGEFREGEGGHTERYLTAVPPTGSTGGSPPGGSRPFDTAPGPPRSRRRARRGCRPGQSGPAA